MINKNRVYAINYATPSFEKARTFNTKSAYKHNADVVKEFRYCDIDAEFKEKNELILSNKRGGGLWLWKPYFIYKVMNESQNGDWIVYSDAGLFYRKNINKYIIGYMKKGYDLISQETRFVEKAYTKRITFIEMNCDNNKYTDTLQRAGIIVLCNNEVNRKLVSEWLYYAQKSELMNHTSTELQYENYPEYIIDNEDQSILSLLLKKYNKPVGRIYTDIIFPIKRGALMTYHHTNADNEIAAWCGSLYRWVKIAAGMIHMEINRTN